MLVENRKKRKEIQNKIDAICDELFIVRMTRLNPLYDERLKLEAEARDIMSEIHGEKSTKQVVYKKKGSDV